MTGRDGREGVDGRAGRLAGRRALVTGAGSGIGRGIAERFAAEGAAVGLVGRRRAPLEETAAAIRAAGGTAVVAEADVSEEAAAERAVEAVASALSGLDVLVNNAGVYRPAPLAATTTSDWDRTIAVNLRGPFLMIRRALDHLARGGGAVVNVSTNLALRPVPGAAAYCVSKAALDMLTRVAAIEGAPRGVRANSLLVGIVDTPIHAARTGTDRESWLASAAGLHPLGRIGAPGDVAGAAVYLASAEAAWVTGALLAVDGGLSLV